MGHALDRSLRHHTTVAILFCDLDHFKVISDTFGTRSATTLMTVADEMGRAGAPGRHHRRFGGDEFVVLAEDLEGPDDAGVLASASLGRP